MGLLPHPDPKSRTRRPHCHRKRHKSVRGFRGLRGDDLGLRLAQHRGCEASVSLVSPSLAPTKSANTSLMEAWRPWCEPLSKSPVVWWRSRGCVLNLLAMRRTFATSFARRELPSRSIIRTSSEFTPLGKSMACISSFNIRLRESRF